MFVGGPAYIRRSCSYAMADIGVVGSVSRGRPHVDMDVAVVVVVIVMDVLLALVVDTTTADADGAIEHVESPVRPGRKIFTTDTACARHTGHSAAPDGEVRRAAQTSHTHTWPHGTTTCVASFSRQMTHSAVDGREDIVRTAQRSRRACMQHRTACGLHDFRNAKNG